MSNIASPIKVEVKADVSEAANEVASNLLANPCKETGSIATTFLEFFHNSVLMPMRKYNIKSKLKLEKYAEDMEMEILKIPAIELVDPSINIIGPTFESLKYNLDEEYIKRMFMNIITSDMTKSKKAKVKPAFVEIVRQLSYEDAALLTELKKYSSEGFGMMQLKLASKNGFKILDKIFLLNESKSVIPNEIVLDNLIRLRLIQIEETKYPIDYEKNKIFANVFEKEKEKYKSLETDEQKIEYQKGGVRITKLGQEFLDICLD